MKSLIVACLAACAVAGCKEPTPAYDFSPPAGTGTVAAPLGGLLAEPVPMSIEERRAPLTPGGRCNLERVNGALLGGAPSPVSKAAPVGFSGWIADVDGKTVPAKFELRFVEPGGARAWKAEGTTGGARKDVQGLLGGDAAFAATGFSLELDLSGMPEGTYRLYAVMSTAKGLQVCDNGRAISVGR